MNSGVVTVVLLVTVVAVLLPLVEGLQCCYCVSNNHPNPGSDPKTPAAHDNCEQGYDLPDNLTQTCTEQNSNDFLNIRGTNAGWKGDFACANRTITTELTEPTDALNNGTHGYARIRTCTLAPTPAKSEKHCEYDLWTLPPSTTLIFPVACYCYKDNCNINKKDIVEKVKPVIDRGSKTNDVVGLGPQAHQALIPTVILLLSARF